MMSGTEDPTQLCRTVVRQLITHNAWQLLSEDALVETVLERISSDRTVGRERLRNLSINTYCRQALYPACLGLQGPQKQKRGFEELAIYLHRIACKAWPQMAKDVTQEALTRIYKRRKQCRKPGAFLAFAIQQLRDAAKKQRKQETSAASLDEWLEQDFYGDIATDKGVGTAQDVGAEEATLYADLKREVATHIEGARQQHPRAHRQLDAVWLRYIQELSTEEAAAILKTTPENVSVLTTRGLKKLRDNKRLRELAKSAISGQ